MTRNTLALRIATAAVAVAAMVLIPVAFAAKGHNSGSASTTTLALASSTVAAGDPFHMSGCGYTVGQPVNVTVDSPSAQYFFSTGVDANGCVSFGYYTSEAGQYMVKTYQGGTKQTLMASAALTAS